MSVKQNRLSGRHRKWFAASDAEWKCLVLHEAPTDTSCEEETSPVAGDEPCRVQRADFP